MMFIRKMLSSIALKLFLSFWLITILSIGITRFVSHQLEQESVIVPVHHGDLRRLRHTLQKIEANAATSAKELLNHLPTPNHSNIVLKEESSKQIYANRKRHLRNISDYLKKNNFTNITTIQFPFVRLTGPENIKLGDNHYQVFISHRTRPPAIGSMILQLPMWLRYFIPLSISMLFCWFLARTLTKPLIAIKKASREIGNGNYDVRVENVINRKDEIGEMALSFNQMAEKLEANMSAHQRLLADVSHELRSPMTRLQMTLGLIQQANQANDTINRHLTRCEQEISQLDGMIANILSLSRMENCFQQIDKTTLELTALISKIVDENKLLSQEKSLTVSLNSDSHLMILGNEGLLTSAFTNVIINAIKYCDQDGKITIDCHRQANKAVISIADNGIGVPSSQLTSLFKPFYRVSDARDRDSGGTGLGLAIAKQAVELHHGKISAENNHSGGLTITLELPLDTV